MRNIEATLLSLILIIGFGVLSNGIVQIASAIDYKRFGLSWRLTLIGGGIGILTGFSLIGNFRLSAVYVSYMVAFHLFSTSISLVASFFSQKIRESRQRIAFRLLKIRYKKRTVFSAFKNGPFLCP